MASVAHDDQVVMAVCDLAHQSWLDRAARDHGGDRHVVWDPVAGATDDLVGPCLGSFDESDHSRGSQAPVGGRWWLFDCGDAGPSRIEIAPTERERQEPRDP